MTTTTRIPEDAEHYVVSVDTFNQLMDMVDGMNGISQMVAGRLSDGQPEVSRNDVASTFMILARYLKVHLESLPRRPGREDAA